MKIITRRIGIVIEEKELDNEGNILSIKRPFFTTEKYTYISINGKKRLDKIEVFCSISDLKIREINHYYDESGRLTNTVSSTGEIDYFEYIED